MMTSVLFLYAAFAFASVAFLTPVLSVIAVKTGFVDQPGGRKKHEKPVPPIGGLAIFPVFLLLSYLVQLQQGAVASGFGWFALALGLLVVTGAIDDKRHIPARFKLVAQFIAALLIVFPGEAVVYYMGDLAGLGPFGLSGFGPVFTVFAIVLLINAINLIDGLDGLAGGIGFVVVFWLLAAVFFGSGSFTMAATLSVFGGCLAGFLLFNLRHPFRHKASVFLGDAGSMALGLTLAWYSITLSQHPNIVIEPVAVAWLLALPVFDTCGQFARRLRLGRHPFSADHAHFHHHFLYAGLTPGKTTALILLLSFSLGAIGIGGMALGVSDYVMAFSWLILLGGHIYMSMRPHRFRRLVNRGIRRMGSEKGRGAKAGQGDQETLGGPVAEDNSHA